jgi:hypothetical protein
VGHVTDLRFAIYYFSLRTLRSLRLVTPKAGLGAKHYLNLRLTLAEYYDMVSKAFRSGELWKAFFIYRPGSGKMRLPPGLTAGNYRFMLRGLYFLI